MKDTPSRKPMIYVPLIFLAMGILGGCQSMAQPTSAVIPTHQCTNWNIKSTSYLKKYSFGSNYIVMNDVWNPVQIYQTLYACNFESFYVSANVQYRDGAVQSYPSAQYTFPDPLSISKFTSLVSSFRVSDPPSGAGLDYEFAYDIWFDGYGGDDHTEMMIWTYTHGRHPSGNEVPGTIVVGGHRYAVWDYSGGGNLVTFVALDNYTAASTDLLPFFSYASSHGWLHSGTSTPLWQIDYGVELAASPSDTKFDFTDFDVRYKT
jgi:Glycosyl hydrolase family 12